MKKKLTAVLTAAALLVTSMSFTAPLASVHAENTARQMEQLDRGLVAVQTSAGIYLSWRLHTNEDNVYGTGTANTDFDIYRDGEKIATESNTTNYIDADGTSTSKYQVVVSGLDKSLCSEVSAFSSGSNYFDIAMDKPEATTLPRTATFTSASGSSYIGFADADGNQISSWKDENAVWDPAEYAINDSSCGDLDGDGEYEIVVKWDCWGKDNSQTGLTGTVYLDAYKLNGTRLWRIDLGRNIRAGAHYTQFLVYDFDGDGKAEVTCKTAPGSKDGTGAYVSSASTDSSINSTDNTASYINDSGYILDGPEYFTIFNGQTGAAEDTIYYPNQRVDVSVWGDTNGNRLDRFTADVAYLDGTTPYAVYMRGYYFGRNGKQRQAACAISFDGSKLNCTYSFDTYDVTSYNSKSSSSSYFSDGTYKGVNGYRSGNEIYVGQGNHNCTVADVDKDGKDEVMTGALCYELENDILTPKWCTFKGHGDALHIGDYDPTHDGYEFFVVHEEGGGTDSMSGQNVTLDYGMSLIDPATGEIIFHKSASKDTGRGMMANVGAGGYYQMNAGSQVATHIAKGNDVFEESSYSFSNNFRIFWDGDLYDELLDGTTITAWNKNSLSMQSIFTADGCTSVNGSKSNPSLQADLFGDWREEVVYPLTDSSALRVYTTDIYTKYKMKSLMYDSVYRSGVAAEQTAYNQPPHIGYYIEQPAINEETIYEKGTGSDTAWLSTDPDAWTQSGTAQLQYSADGADYGDIYYTETNPTNSYSATKTFDIKSGATVTYNLVWRYGGVISKNTTNMGGDTNYTYLQFGDNIRLAWFGAPSNYYLYYSTDGGTTYTASSIKYYNKTYHSNVIATVDTSTNTLTSLSVDGQELVSNTKVSDTPDSVTFGFIKGNASLYSSTTAPDTAIDSIKVTQEYETASEPTPTPTASATPTPSPTPENLYTFDDDVAAVTETGVTTWNSGSLNGWFLNRNDANGTVQVKDGGINVYVNSNNKTYLGLHADTAANVKDKIVQFGFDYKTSSVSSNNNSCTEIVVFSTDDNNITYSSWSGNGASKKTCDTGMAVDTVYNVLYTIDNTDHTISYTITDSEENVIKEETLTNSGDVDVNTIVFRTGKYVTDVIDNFWYTVKSKEVPVTLSGISVTPPTKTTYIEGQELDKTGMIVTAFYSDDTNKDVTADCSISGYDKNRIGKQTITVTYSGKTATFTVTVNAKSLTNITVTPPTKTAYIEGETLDTTGMVITAVYDNSTSETITSGFSLSEYNKNKTGEQTITVTYGEKTAEFTVNVIAKSLTNITVTPPTKTAYIEGETLDTAGMTVTAVYDNSTSETITSGFSLSEYNKNKTGEQTITVSYGGKTATFTVTVSVKEVISISVKSQPSKTTYIEGDDLDTTGLVISAAYNNGTSEDISIGFNTSGYDSSKIGTQTITVSYEGKTATFTVTVSAKTLTDITVTPPTDTDYFIGEELDTTDMVVTAVYNNGTSEVIADTDYEVTGFDSTTAGTKTVTVTYNEKSKTFEVTVREKPELQSLELVSPPSKTVYTVGEEIDKTGLIINAVYSDGSKVDVTNLVKISANYDNTTPGEKTITFVYYNKTVKITVTYTAEDAPVSDPHISITSNSASFADGYFSGIIKAKAKNCSYDADNAVMILAVYGSDGILDGVQFKPITSDDTEFNVNTSTDSRFYYQIFAWNGFNTLLPVCKPYDSRTATE